MRHLHKLRSAKYDTITKDISKCYQKMHLRAAHLTKQFGQTQLAIINWRILFETRYLTEIKSLVVQLDSNDNFFDDANKKQKETADLAPNVMDTMNVPKICTIALVELKKVH